MLKDNLKIAVEKATVNFLKKGGQGVLVEGGFILTAAHCIDCNCEGDMTMDEYIIEEIETINGNLKIQPFAVEPVKDIAVLGSLDDQAFNKEATQFEKYCDNIKPIPLCTNNFELDEKKFVSYIFTHKKSWVKATTIYIPTRLDMYTEEPIESGTSGSPIVNEKGELIGIVSQSKIDSPELETGEYFSHGSHPNMTLPVWVLKKILSPEEWDSWLLEERKLLLR